MNQTPAIVNSMTDSVKSRGLLIAFEGGDGAGKSTQAARLAQWMRKTLGHDVVETRQPGGTSLGTGLRSLLLDGEAVDAHAEALLFAADRAHHVNTSIRPALDAGQDVICDRYVDSSIAYQSGGRGLPLADVLQLSMWGTAELLPDLTILLDVDSETAAQRREGRGEGDDRMEREEGDFHERVRQTFRALAEAEPWRYLVIDASQTPDHITKRIRERVRELALDREETMEGLAVDDVHLDDAMMELLPTSLGSLLARARLDPRGNVTLVVRSAHASAGSKPQWDVAEVIDAGSNVNLRDVVVHLDRGPDAFRGANATADRVTLRGVSNPPKNALRGVADVVLAESKAYFEQHPHTWERMVAAVRLRHARAEHKAASTRRMSYEHWLDASRAQYRAEDARLAQSSRSFASAASAEGWARGG